MSYRIIRYLTAALVVIVGALSFAVYFQYRKIQFSNIFSTTDKQISVQLARLDLPVVEREVKEGGILFFKKVASLKVEIPRDYSIDEILERLKEKFGLSGIRVFNLREDNLEDIYKINIDIGKENILTHRLTFYLKKARVALLIDDFGYRNDRELLDVFFEKLSFPFTVSIIPGTPFSREIAQKAHMKGKQVIVHMPMQPKGSFSKNYRWIVLEGMDAEDIKQKVREAIKSVPYAEGLNNHMGSLVTSRRELIKQVLEVLKERGMFFIDSKTSPHSVAYLVAREIGVKSTFNCVFLDNKKDAAHIEAQFKKLIMQALREGWALGLGHCDIITARTLERLVRNCDKRKIKFVPASKILN